MIPPSEITITSVSGGKTSGYIAANYDSDYVIFSLVCVDDPACGSKDKFLMQYANDKVYKYCSLYGDVIGTAESPIIFQTMYEMEQFIGKEIIWLRGESFDSLIKRKGGLPGKAKGSLGRFCTTFLKIEPLFEFWFKYIAPVKVGVNVGYRYDEKERCDTFSTTWDYKNMCNLYGQRRNKWVMGEQWRYGIFKLVEDGIFHKDIKSFWDDKPVTFAKDSNCQFCIFKQQPQITMNCIDSPDQMYWASSKELNYKWHKDFSVEQAWIKSLSNDFVYGTGAGCDAGECVS